MFRFAVRVCTGPENWRWGIMGHLANAGSTEE